MNLKEIKNLAILYLHYPLSEVPQLMGVLVQHPFFTSYFVCNGSDYFDMRLDKEKTKVLYESLEKQIRQCKSLRKLEFMITPPYRLNFLIHIYKEGYADAAECGAALCHTWSLLEYNDSVDMKTKKIMLKWLSAIDRNTVMTADERKVYEALPQKVTCYRGLQPKEKPRGFSWSLDKSVAEWFSRRYSGKGIVYTTVIDKNDILFYDNSREEKEIVVDFTKIGDIERI